jgi:hypothetical protein
MNTDQPTRCPQCHSTTKEVRGASESLRVCQHEWHSQPNAPKETQELRMWPPPTEGMTADELRKLWDISNESVRHSLIALKEQCSKEGHVWGKATSHFKEEGGYSFCSGLGQTSIAPVRAVKYFTRKCTRCGNEETKRAIEQPALSPFNS